MWVMASATWATPLFCSALAWLMSEMSWVTLRISSMACSMVSPANAASWLPVWISATLWLMSCLISLAASALRPARARTSSATTAKPRPCSPARAASTAALRARILVWKAMPSMTPMMSAIFLLLASMPCMVCTTLRTACPPSVTTRWASRVMRSADCAWSALWATVEPSSSMAAAVCSSALASLSVRAARSWLPWAISALARATLWACSFTPPTTRVRPVLVVFMASSRWPISSWRSLCTRKVRSPSAMA